MGWTLFLPQTIHLQVIKQLPRSIVEILLNNSSKKQDFN